MIGLTKIRDLVKLHSSKRSIIYKYATDEDALVTKEYVGKFTVA